MNFLYQLTLEGAISIARKFVPTCTPFKLSFYSIPILFINYVNPYRLCCRVLDNQLCAGEYGLPPPAGDAGDPLRKKGTIKIIRMQETKK